MTFEDPKNSPEQRRCDTDERRAQIALAARGLIVERGFEGLRMRDIAERVGINVATLHYHVPSKEALVELLAKSLRDEFIAQQEQRPRSGLCALEQLRHEFADFRETEVENPARHKAMAELAERAERDEKVAAVIRPMQAYWHGQLAGILATGREDGSFRADIDPQAAASMVIGAMISARKRDDDIEFFDRVAAEIERSLVTR
ncbi:MAG: TetR/AcrR family transcriptional regulator [Nitratireductor sp.]|nr:TetR/AcrR family transcriptional regulator [Nitratireductor sp.]